MKFKISTKMIYAEIDLSIDIPDDQKPDTARQVHFQSGSWDKFDNW